MKALYFLFLSLALSGCELARPAVKVHSYLPPPLTSRASQPLNARIGRFEVATAFEAKPLIWRLSETRYESDFYNEYLVTPRAMLRDRAAKWLGLEKLPESQSLGAPLYLLDIQVSELYGDVRSVPAFGVLRVRFVLNDANGSPILDRDYEVRTRLKTNSAEALVQGISEGFDNILSRFERDVRGLSGSAVGQPALGGKR